MATIDNACSNAPTRFINNGYANTTPSFKKLEIKIESCGSHVVLENSPLTVSINSEADLITSKDASDLPCKSVIGPNLEFLTSNNPHSSTDLVENSDANAVICNSPEVSSDNHSITGIAHLNSNEISTANADSINDGATSNELPNSSSVEPLDTDENTTQIRLSPTAVELEKNSDLLVDDSAMNLSPNTANHLFIEATLNAQSQEESHDITVSLLHGNHEDSDKESIESLANQCNGSSDLNEISTPVTALEESSLDSGIASLDDNEQTPKSSTELESKNEKKKFMKLGLTPTGILGRKRRYKELSTPQAVEKRQFNNSKSRVCFDGVTVFYFPRKQSFVTVPSQGGSTLGMSLRHSHSKKMSLTQHKHAIARHRQKVIEQQKKQFKIDARIKQLRQTYPDMEMAQLVTMVTENEAEESQESSDEEELRDVDDHESSSDDDLDDDNYYLQPIPAKKRRILLRMAGVQKIDLDEKFSNKLTRESREVCGCDCENVCLPSTCQCALAGIPCQVDRESFPCGCVVSGCCNQAGRVEFDAHRVKKHYFRTMRKLRLQETGAITPNENEELPQPPKSPYVSALERAEDLYGGREENADGGSSMLPFSSSLPAQSTYDQHIQMSTNSSFNLSAVESWSMPYNSNNCGTNLSPAANYASDGVQSATFDHFGQDSYFDSSTFSDVTSSFLATDLTSNEHILTSSTVPSATPLSNFDSGFRDFSFGDEHFPLSAESKLSSVFAEGNQLGSRQTFKLDPITSFFPCAATNGRRISQESSFLLDLPDTYSHFGDMLGHSPNPPSVSPQPCSIESLLCSEEQPASRSRSSSMSECSHDSIVKA